MALFENSPSIQHFYKSHSFDNQFPLRESARQTQIAIVKASKPPQPVFIQDFDRTFIARNNTELLKVSQRAIDL